MVTLKIPLGSQYLHGFVVPAVAPVLILSSSVEHQRSTVGVSQFNARRVVQTHQTQTALNHV